jgi:glycosyltransferase involved in cell wall biosynthesis
MQKTKILFISRAYPPTVGGIENHNYELAKWLGEIADVKIIANKKGKKFLPVFLPYFILRSIFIAHKYDAILLGDGVLGIVGWFAGKINRKPVVCVVHGLDLTFTSWIYQKLWVGFFIKELDKLIAVGNETVRVGIEKGIPAEKIVFIPNGVDTEKNLVVATDIDLEKILGQDVENKKVILTSGRLAKRKGVAWFVRNVMPRFAENIIYVVAGDGKDKENIQAAIKEAGMENRVIMLGYVTNEVRNILWNTCDVFVKPNIKIDGDMEGFGISVIEAASCYLPVVASDIEGLRDAIKDGRDGFLVESANADAFAQKITSLLSDDVARIQFGKQARQFVIENYSWNIIAKKYLEEIREVL